MLPDACAVKHILKHNHQTTNLEFFFAFKKKKKHNFFVVDKIVKAIVLTVP